jgi:hypothetical protein
MPLPAAIHCGGGNRAGGRIRVMEPNPYEAPREAGGRPEVQSRPGPPFTAYIFAPAALMGGLALLLYGHIRLAGLFIVIGATGISFLVRHWIQSR